MNFLNSIKGEGLSLSLEDGTKYTFNKIEAAIVTMNDGTPYIIFSTDGKDFYGSVLTEKSITKVNI